MTIYFRNPDRYRDAVMETEVNHFSWDLGRISRQRIDIFKWGKLFLSSKPEWKMLVVAQEGVAEYDQDSRDIYKPNAVYPSWHSSDGFKALEDYCKKPVGEDLKLCFNDEISGQFRPVWRQPHKVVIYSTPDIRSKAGGAELKRMMELVEKYNVELIMHDTESFRLMFGTRFAGSTFDPYHTARKGSVILPTGGKYQTGDLHKYQKWVNLLGFNIGMLHGEQALHQRLLFNIESVHWANENFNKNIEFVISATQGFDMTTKRGKYEIKEAREAWLTGGGTSIRMSLGPDDGYACDACSIKVKCKFYREGMVCGVTKGKTIGLVNEFGTRDAGVIIDGLTKLTGIMAKRVEADLQDEDESGERKLETDKRIKDLMDAGVKVAKLIDPNLNGRGATVNIGMIGGAVAVGQQTPQELMANAIRTLEANGVDRADITPDMIKGLLEGVNNRAIVERTIEAEAIEVSGEITSG